MRRENRDIWDEIETAGHGESLEEEMFELLSAYADGECSPKERRLVEAYLVQIPGGSTLISDIRAQSALSAWSVEEPPDWLREAILRRTMRRAFSPAVRARVVRAAVLTAAAAAALMFFLPRPVQTDTSRLVARNSVPLGRVVGSHSGKADRVPAKSSRPEAPPASKRPAGRRFGSADGAAANEQKPPAGTGGGLFLLAALSAQNEPTEPSGSSASAAAPAEHTAVAYRGPQTSDEPAPANVDSLTAGEEAQTVHAAARQDAEKPKDQVLAEARQRLRERLKKLNENRTDIKEAVGGN